VQRVTQQPRQIVQPPRKKKLGAKALKRGVLPR
jgi:hypothetical protein